MKNKIILIAAVLLIFAYPVFRADNKTSGKAAAPSNYENYGAILNMLETSIQNVSKNAKADNAAAAQAEPERQNGKTFRQAADCGGIKLNLSNTDTFSKLYEALLKNKDYLVLVDKQHPLPADYKPQDFTDLQGYQARAQAAKQFKEMASAALSERIKLTPVSVYRSYQYQANLYERRKKESGAEHVAKYIAQAGHSQHQLGTAVDINATETTFKDTPAFAWLSMNAGKYGYSLSFPENQEGKTGFSFEPWHYRYITPEGIKMQDEFFKGSQQDFLEFVNKCFPAGK